MDAVWLVYPFLPERNQAAMRGKTWVEIDRQDLPSKRVTLRACAVLKAVYG